MKQYITFVYRSLLTILAVCLCDLSLFAQDITIDASLETDSMRIGEQQKLSLSIEYKSSKTFILPQFGKEIAQNICIADTFNFVPHQESETIARLEAKIPITCFEAGKYSFEVGPFIYSEDTVWSSPIQLVVQTVVLDSTEIIKPIKPIRTPEYSFKDYLPNILIIIGIILGIALIIFGIWYFLKHKKSLILPTKSITKEKADVKALRELENLKIQNLCENDEFKKYYTELTDILRSYFGDVLNIDTFEKTSDEIIKEVVSTGKVPLSVIQNLQMILQEADFVKFAKHKPTVETGNLHYGLSLFCINESKHLVEDDNVKNPSSSY